jgi:hypothetical protein
LGFVLIHISEERAEGFGAGLLGVGHRHGLVSLGKGFEKAFCRSALTHMSHGFENTSSEFGHLFAAFSHVSGKLR